ncbi:MAG: nucleotide exchange factor GrpE [Syntrophorhabdus sp.]
MEEKEEKKTKEKGETQEDHKKKKKKDEVVEELQQALEEKEELLKELNNKFLYLQADFENFKKIKAKEKQDLLKFGNEVLIKELIPVIDNLERAIDHAGKSEEAKGIVEGIQITLNEFLKVLERSGVERIDAMGKKFDPNFHEALFQEDREDMEPDMVTSVILKGYTLNGRLLRPSRVSVSKKPEAH